MELYLVYFSFSVANKSWELLHQTRIARPHPGIFFLVWGILGEIAYGLCVVAFTRPHQASSDSRTV